MHLFGKSKKKEAEKPDSSPNAAITVLKEQISMLQKRKEVMEHKANQELEKAKELLKKKTDRDKRAATSCLARKKMFMGNVDQVDAMIMNLEVQVMQIEQMKMNVETFKSQQVGTNAMKEIQKDYTVEKLEEIQMDMQDQMDIAKEMSDALTTPMNGAALDEDDLMDELNNLEQDLANESMGEVLATEDLSAAVDALSIPAPPSGLPAVAARPKVAETDEERELRELEASMA